MSAHLIEDCCKKNMYSCSCAAKIKELCKLGDFKPQNIESRYVAGKLQLEYACETISNKWCDFAKKHAFYVKMYSN